MNLKLTSPSANKTFDIGRQLGSHLKGNELILLLGDLGAGKTLITKGIATSLGIDSREIVSPTFTLMNQFEYPLHPEEERDILTAYFIHFDCYRFADQSGAEKKSRKQGLIVPEIDEWIDEAIVAVEWAQYLHSSYFSLPNSIRIFLEIATQQTRNITVESELEYI